jgi:hypothetical protein
MGSQFDPLPLSRVGSRERAPSLNFPQLDFVKPSSGFHPVTWERVIDKVTCFLRTNLPIYLAPWTFFPFTNLPTNPTTYLYTYLLTYAPTFLPTYNQIPN